MSRLASTLGRAAVISGTAAAVIGITAGTALAAAPTYTIKAASQTTGTLAYTAATPTGTSSAPSIVFKDTTSGLNLGCISGTAKGAFPLGANHAAAKIATITGTGWKTCTGPAGLTLVPVQSGTWYVNGTAATTSAGVSKGYVSGVSAKVSATPTASACNFTVTGTADGTFTNSTNKLALAPVSTSGHKLVVSGVTGCYGLINNNDVVTFSASYQVTTAKGKITVTSP